MALANERSFRLYVTHVDSEGHFLKISGQLDQQGALVIESLFQSARDNLENGVGAVTPAVIQEGIICAAKYKDGVYYRAKIINTSNLSKGLVGVHFIDYGNKDLISLSTIRYLDNYDTIFQKMPGLSSDYYLSRVMHPSGRWEEPLILKLQSLLCYADYPATIEAQTRSLPLIAVQFKGNDLSSHLVTKRFGISCALQKQEVLLLQLSGEMQHNMVNWQPITSEAYTEPLPFAVNQNFPLNPASAMRLQQTATLPFNGTVPPPSLISQRLLVNKVSRTPVNLKPPMRQPQNIPPAISMATPPPPFPVAANKPPSPKKSSTYKSKLLEVGTQHRVYVSYSEEGPELFAVQLASEAQRFQDMMDEINRRPHRSLTEPPMIGTVCLGRMSGDRMICRAIVMNLSGSQCKLFFVDFGDTEMVSYYDIFDIPEEFVKPNVFALRFCLSGVKKLEKGLHLNEIFKQLVNAKFVTLKVVSPEGPPLIQYGELYLDNQNILELLLANMKDKLQFKWMDMLSLGSRRSVLVSYVDSCVKFYVQLSDKIDELNAVMEAVKVHCENSSCPGELPVGAACCARFPDDDNWYRALIRGTKGNKVVVAYVDYGNEQEVEVSDLRTITPDLIKLPAQALKCGLKGFENKPVETKTSNQLEMLALEKTLMAHIVGVLSNDTMLVSLVDDTVSPPLDVARKMTQLSQPRSNIEPKVTTPVRKEAPESFSSPEGSEDSRKKSFRREKSFKEERRPREEDFGQRGSSFRTRDNKEPFERSGPARHSDKFARPDKGESRGKPWENNTSAQTSAPAPTGEDEWEETSPPATSFQPRQNRDNRERDNRDNRDRDNRDNRDRDNRDGRDNRDRDNRDRDNHRERDNNRDRDNRDRDNNRDWDNRDRDNKDRRKPWLDRSEGHRPGWRGKEGGGVGRRLRQAAEAASAESQPPEPRGFSVQDRLKRDNKFNKYNDREGREDSGSKFNRDRPDRRDFREKRDNWGDKKDNFQKREFRERGDRAHSNFTPRDRAERSFGSDDKSERSFRSQDSGGRAGRAPPYKSRSKFTQVQYKELPDPVPLETEFEEPTVEPNAQHEVAVTWIITPESFYTQILSLQPKFLEMMHKIPEIYKGVKSFTGLVPVGASVLARYPADGVLYRATVVSVQPFSKFIVRYVDFGNKQLVDAKDIWQLDRQLLELPKMAVHCALVGVSPTEGEWKANPEIDLCFNAPRYQCAFLESADGLWKVSLWNNGVSVADTMVEKQLAITSGQQSSVALKDEAIDLTIIVGQQMLCKVTYVESFEKFYVQLDLDKAALVENAIANFDASKLTPLTADCVSDGIHTTVKHDGKIYRAILSDVSDAENIQAVLPDYGMSITTSLANLMILPTELSLYYYQSLHCCFNNYTADSKTLMSLEELKTKLTDKKVIIYINNVEGISLVSTLYDISTGAKIAVFSPDEGAYDEVVPLCARAVFNYTFGTAYISHMENLNEFYLQKTTDTESLEHFLNEMYAFYEEGTPEEQTNFEVDDLCVAKSSDGNWYRATIVSSEDDNIKVQFSDYGNMETVTKDVIKKLDPKFHEPCAYALVASLGLVALQDDAVAKLKEWTTEKEVQVTLTFGNDGWLASLHLDGVDLAMKLVNEKLATPKLSSDEEMKTEAPAEEPISLPQGCTQVYISHIDTPGHFWLQMADKIDKIDEIQAELQANTATYADIENREMGTLCVAKYLADEQWYRAEILDSDADITTVRFIDYGNTDVLDNQPDLIKSMPDHLKDIDRLAVKSSVNAVPTGTGEWSEPASEFFTQLVGDISVPVDALIVLKDVTTYVDIFVNGHNLTDKLVAEGYAGRSADAECGDLPSCFASHINSPSEFWIQLETAAPELQAMEAAMVDAENFPELVEKEEGVICAAKYPEDGAWYRAQVIVDGSEGTEVLFMDYGNASIANELRNLPDELKVKPALSRKCALQKPRNIKTWSRKSEVKFNELAAEGATIFNVQFIASGDISIVDLYLEGKSVTEELVNLCEEHPVAERPPPVGQDLHSSGKVCYVNSLEEFYVQLDSNNTELDKIFDRLSGAAEFESVSDLKVGSTCTAFWDEDEQWYRAKILEFCDSGYHVQFMDYGNKAKCEELRQLPEDLASVEPMAKCCSLAGLTGEQNDAVKDKLDELAADIDCTFQIEFLDSTKEPALVKLFVRGEDLISLANKSTPTESSSEIVTASNQEVPETEKVDTEVVNDDVDNEQINEDDLCSGLNSSGNELNVSIESSNTVIENKSFEAKADSLTDDITEADNADVTPTSPHKDTSSETLNNSSETIKTPERDISKDSLATDTGYTSDQEKSPATETSEAVSITPDKEITEKEITEPSEQVKAVEVESETAKVTESPKKETVEVAEVSKETVVTESAKAETEPTVPPKSETAETTVPPKSEEQTVVPKIETAESAVPPKSEETTVVPKIETAETTVPPKSEEQTVVPKIETAESAVPRKTEEPTVPPTTESTVPPKTEESVTKESPKTEESVTNESPKTETVVENELAKDTPTTNDLPKTETVVEDESAKEAPTTNDLPKTETVVEDESAKEAPTTNDLPKTETVVEDESAKKAPTNTDLPKTEKPLVTESSEKDATTENEQAKGDVSVEEIPAKPE